MRFLTIVVSLLLGMALCVLFLYNQDAVKVEFLKLSGGKLAHAAVLWPVWKIVGVAAVIGAIFGYLIGISSVPSHPAPSAPKPQPESKPVQEVDYLLAVQKKPTRGNG